MFLDYRKKAPVSEHKISLKGASVPLAIVGAYMFIMGLWGQMTWPLPGSYNILFYDPMIAFGMLTLAFAFAIRFEVRLEYAGFLGLMTGVMALIYGYEGYGIGLTSSPFALLMLYLFYGGAGIFSYPLALIADRMPGLKKNVWWGWNVFIALFVLAMFVASLTAAYVASQAIGGHLLSAP